MSDIGSEYADERIRAIERKLNKIYSEASKDLEEKIRLFTKKYETKEKIHLKELEDEKITQDDFDAWKRGQVFQSEQWKAKKKQILHTLTQTNEMASQIVNDEAVKVFTMNGNFAAYDLEKTGVVNFGFPLYDATSVVNIVKQEDPYLLPQWKIDEPKDYVWNSKKVGNQITQGIIQGEKLDQIAKRLAKNLCMQNKNSSLTFARTAMTGAQNGGRSLRYRQAEKLGINMHQEWMATLDGRTRHSHRSMDGEKIPVGEDFKFSNKCRYPGDPEGPPWEVYNCRCTLVADLDDYPAEYERYDNIDGKPIRSMSYNEWFKIKKSEKSTGIKINLPTPKDFKRDFDIAKSTIPKGSEWRVDDTYTVQDYEHKKLLELQGGSTVAVTEDGDIVSVCKNIDSKSDKGSDLLNIAIANGGEKLDAFGPDLYKFYTKNGFEPVSWTPFNEEYAPHDWVKGRDNAEPVIFYKYTGKKINIEYKDFLSNVKPSAEYDDAMKIRNDSIGRK